MSTAEMAMIELKNAPEEIAQEALKLILALKQQNPCKSRKLDPMGYPMGYFDRTAGSFANEPLDRPAQASLDPATVW